MASRPQARPSPSPAPIVHVRDASPAEHVAEQLNEHLVGDTMAPPLCAPSMEAKAHVARSDIPNPVHLYLLGFPLSPSIPPMPSTTHIHSITSRPPSSRKLWQDHFLTGSLRTITCLVSASHLSNPSRPHCTTIRRNNAVKDDDDGATPAARTHPGRRHPFQCAYHSANRCPFQCARHMTQRQQHPPNSSASRSQFHKDTAHSSIHSLDGNRNRNRNGG
ncbi:hypothetical protein BJ912DRAFT_527430 [Pholiota molesta]|nr:hypothetical protein BJ912DRAFT_527430 [Pholiota molesta]